MPASTIHNSWFRLFTLLKDTISADEKHDKIEADDNTQLAYSSVSLYAVVHHGVPIFSGQDLNGLNNMRNECIRLIENRYISKDGTKTSTSKCIAR